MKPGLVLALAQLALAPAPSLAAQQAPERRGQVFALDVHRNGEETTYTAYHWLPGHPEKLVVQRGSRWSSDRRRVEVSAAACPGLHEAVAGLERTPWPSIRLDVPSQTYLDRERYVGYSFTGMIGHAGAISWESKLYFRAVHGEPHEPFAAWADDLVRTVDACLALRA